MVVFRVLRVGPNNLVIGSATGSALGDFQYCRFASCYTSKTDKTLHDGAIYLSVIRVQMINVCGSTCVSFKGTFLSVGGCASWEVSFQSSECPIWNCSTERSFDNFGIAIQIGAGAFELAETNFSDCRQDSEAFAIEQGNRASTNLLARVFLISSFRSKDDSGFCLINPCSVPYDLCLFRDNDVAKGLFYSAAADNLYPYVTLCSFLDITDNFSVRRLRIYLFPWLIAILFPQK
jgi:hypothetical protein